MKIIICLLLLGIVAVSGCINLPLFKSKELTPEMAFIGGSEGLSVKFVDLPSKIFPDTIFNIRLLVENKGEASVPANTAEFVLNNAQTFGIPEANIAQTINIALPAVQKLDSSIIASQPIEIMWPNARFTGLVLTEEQSVPLSIDVCYPYSTYVLAQGCAARTNKICEPDAVKVAQNSGSPVHITSLRNIAIPKDSGQIELALIMEIQNVGAGTVYDGAVICDSLGAEDKDVVWITGISFGGKYYDVNTACPVDPMSKRPTIMLGEDGKATMTCRIIVDTATDIQDDLVIELTYRYKESLSSSISVIPL